MERNSCQHATHDSRRLEVMMMPDLEVTVELEMEPHLHGLSGG